MQSSSYKLAVKDEAFLFSEETLPIRLELDYIKPELALRKHGIYEAGIAIHNIYAPTKHKIDPDKLSWVLFSDPQIASVGLDEESAKNSEIEVVVERYDYRSDARAQIDKATLGMVKFVIDKKSGVIIGIQIFSEDASSLVGEASLIVSAKMTPMQVMSAIHPHPTLTEAFGNLARTIFFKSMMKRG